MSELVTVSEAASALGLNKSTVSRQVQKLGIRKDSRGRFPLAVYKAARGDELNPLMRRNKGEPFSHLDEPGEDVPGEAAPAPSSAGRNGNGKATLSNAATAEKAWGAKLKQLDYETKLGRVVERAEVEAVLFETGRRLRDAVLAVPNDIAEQLAAETDKRKCKKILRDALVQALVEVGRELRPAAGAGDGPHQP